MKSLKRVVSQNCLVPRLWTERERGSSRYFIALGCVDNHGRLSCLPPMFCSVNLNNVWACVGSVTYKQHGRMPGIDALSCYDDTDDSPSSSGRGNAHVCVRARARCFQIRMGLALYNTKYVFLRALAVGCIRCALMLQDAASRGMKRENNR